MPVTVSEVRLINFQISRNRNVIKSDQMNNGENPQTTYYSNKDDENE